jgi:hypothetical protein
VIFRDITLFNTLYNTFGLLQNIWHRRILAPLHGIRCVIHEPHASRLHSDLGPEVGDTQLLVDSEGLFEESSPQTSRYCVCERIILEGRYGAETMLVSSLEKLFYLTDSLTPGILRQAGRLIFFRLSNDPGLRTSKPHTKGGV